MVFVQDAKSVSNTHQYILYLSHSLMETSQSCLQTFLPTTLLLLFV